MDIKFAGENSLIVYFTEQNLIENNQFVAALCLLLEQGKPSWLVDYVPSYQSVLVNFDIQKIDYLAVKKWLLLQNVAPKLTAEESSDIIKIPVWYDADIDNDLERISKLNDVTIDEIKQLHQSTIYRVYAIGFSPGFAFLGEVPASIATPRLSHPRPKVPAGAVAIADRQTAIYPTTTPGGWNIIGLSPARLFDVKHQPACIFKVGDSVQFFEIDGKAYQQWSHREG